MVIATRRAQESDGNRAETTDVYTLTDGTRVRVRAGSPIPEGAVPDALRDGITGERAADTSKRETKARKVAPENRSDV